MSESIVEQILAKFETDLDAIVGDNGTTYWYTPDKVVRVPKWAREWLKPEYNTIYLIRDTVDTRLLPGDEFGSESEDIYAYVMVAQQDKRSQQDPFKASTKAGTIRERMIQDVANKMTSTPTLGGLAEFGINYVGALREIEVEGGGWIAAELAFELRYTHARGAL